MASTGSKSVNINSEWHYNDSPDRKVTGKLEVSYSDLKVTAKATIKQSKRLGYSGWSGYDDTLYVKINGTEVGHCSVDCPTQSTDVSAKGSLTLSSGGSVTVSAYMQCGDPRL